ncbi:MAG: protein translocase subunit SecD [Acidimicrobiia bacterium]
MSRRLILIWVVVLVAWGGLALVFVSDNSPKLGLDLQGGTSVILRAPEGTEPDVLEVAVELMRTRIEDLGGVQEPEISISGDSGVLVDLPGVVDQNRALDAIGQTGALSFRPVLKVGVAGVSPLLLDRLLPPDPGDEETGETAPTTTIPLPAGVDENGLTILDDPAREAWLAQTAEDGTVVAVYHVGPAFLVGADVADARAIFGSSGGAGTPLVGASGFGEWIVQLDFTAEGADRFAEVTRTLASFGFNDPRRQLAIVLDGEVVSAPGIAQTVDPTEGITGGSATITMGSGDQEAASNDLAVVLRYGALPVPFERDQVQTVSATLGEDALRAGLVAGLAGLVLVLGVMVALYRALGLVTVVGLTVFGSLIVMTFGVLGTVIGLTLTLAGVAGVIVAIGITADSYIVYFERIKEEVRKGRNIRAAVSEGFDRALKTILTADSVSFLGAFLLWALAVGPVKGFALALGIATLIDVFVAYFFTRPAVAWLASGPLAESGAFSIRRAARVPAEATT